MSRAVRLDPAKYPGIRPIFTFKKWGAARALGVMDWVATAYGAEAAEAVAGALRALVMGQTDASSAAASIGSLLRAHGSAGVWEAFLGMCSSTAGGPGLYRDAASAGTTVPIYPSDDAARAVQVKDGYDPDTFFADEPLEPLMLVLAMLCETFRPFGLAWGSVAPLFASMAPTPISM